MREHIIKYLYIACFLSVIIIILTGHVCFAASGINSNEQDIINRVKAGFYVDGKYYTVDTKYINQGINYMNQDGVDITKEQKDMIFAKMTELAPEGVARGYLKPSEALDEVKEEVTGDNPDVTETGEEGEVTKNSGSNTVKSDNKGSTVTENEPSNIKDSTSNDKKTDREKEESKVSIDGNTDFQKESGDSTQGSRKSMDSIISSAKEIADSMGVSVSYDLGLNEVKVVNERGKSIMSTDMVIKNTGFNLNRTIVFGVLFLSVIPISIIYAKHKKLFDL